MDQIVEFELPLQEKALEVFHVTAAPENKINEPIPVIERSLDETIEGIHMTIAVEPSSSLPLIDRWATKLAIGTMGISLDWSKTSRVKEWSISMAKGENKKNAVDYLPKGWHILYIQDNTQIPSEAGTTVAIPALKTILVSGNPRNAETHASLLHEIGHARRFNKYLNENPNTNLKVIEARRKAIKGEKTTDEEKHEILSDERDAWAFALELLEDYGPYSSQTFFTTQNLINFIHSVSLRSYNEWIANELEKEITH